MMERYFGPGGKLSTIMEGFEHRAGQAKMADAVSATLTDGGYLLVEAGTGTGKTLAYLLPAVVSGLKVVVSTGTKNLQEQIIEKDIPVLEKLFPQTFTAAVMKGRGNYLCRRRFKNFSQQPLFADSREGKMFATIQAWAAQTVTGDRAELSELPDDYAAWTEINSKSELCLGSSCSFYEACFVTMMRKEAAVADIVVVNHHLFFADLNVRDSSFGEVIPRYDAVIFDEAHLVEQTATAYFGSTLSSHRINEAVRDAQRELQAARLLDGDADMHLNNIQARATAFFEKVRRGMGETRRLKAKDHERLADGAESLVNAMNLMSDHLGSIRKATDPVRALSIRFADIGQQVREMIAMDNDDNVYWVEARGRGVFLHSSPIDVSGHLKEKLYPRSGAAVFTSATLAANAKFGFIRSRLGLDDAGELLIDSPFDYQSQAVFYLPADLPDPGDPSFADRAAERIGSLLALSKGRAFVLFTSHRNLDKCWELIGGRLPYTALKQGDGPRSVILDKFREDTHSTLFATASFWQGVDVKGEALSAVIIDKLPFAMPDDPLVAARIERIEKKGGSAFREYQLPSAALALKQGLGRLIRSKTDRGLLAVLDKRMKTRSYGKTFFRALPGMPAFSDLDRVRGHLEEWWGPLDAPAPTGGSANDGMKR